MVAVRIRNDCFPLQYRVLQVLKGVMALSLVGYGNCYRSGDGDKYYHPGNSWLDTDVNPIQAHGGGCVRRSISGTYYWYESTEKFPRMDVIGVGCYSSKICGHGQTRRFPDRSFLVLRSPRPHGHDSRDMTVFKDDNEDSGWTAPESPTVFNYQGIYYIIASLAPDGHQMKHWQSGSYVFMADQWNPAQLND
ncbi:hypothetical protein F3Y22_tig00110160pilonHSYRG00310 [Hibiscus syriacus]|uniref:Uncharacterized protein n=1 Tax=Hibiscus syriacus TaxID=106335 RepID=A0A6A3BLM7_HIBSY|nr:hypothetical protein F3Y22_tig00110160pilonHSYRG00310 [Hibiscus syriacus]